MTNELDPLIGGFSHDAHRPRAADALLTLRKIASLVKPIMRARGWRVGTLAEFYPEQHNLLGINCNRGQKICLRLRYATDANQFLPMEQVIDTCLHELAHNVFGPHDAKFHALWDQLRDEYEALVRKGYTGEGFLSEGKRLGGRIGASPRVTMEEARRQARAAAGRRKQAAALAAGSGQKLGGRAPERARDIREVIAGAADRRKAITQGCGANIESESGRRTLEAEADVSTRNGFQTKAEEDEANERAIMQAYMELVQEEERERLGEAYMPATQENPAGSRGGKLPVGEMLPPRPPPVPTATKPTNISREPPRDSGSGGSNAASASPSGWSCDICTLFNQPTHLCCDACGTERPSSTLTAIDLTNVPDDYGSGTNDYAAGGGHKRARSSVASSSRSKAVRADGGKLLKPRGDRETVERIFAAAEAQKQRPVGWKCHSCGNFMEMEWWTCARCGVMKASS